MATEVHIAPGHDINCFIKECACLFHNRIFESHLFLSFYIQFCKYYVSITFQCALIFVIKRKIKLMSDVCFKPPILLGFTICM
jgi:hypothetical protein